MAKKSFLTDAELDALTPATDTQIKELTADFITTLVENDIDAREYMLPKVVVPVLQIMKRLEAAEAALLEVVYLDTDGNRWRVGLHGDTAISAEAAAAAQLASQGGDDA